MRKILTGLAALPLMASAVFAEPRVVRVEIERTPRVARVELPISYGEIPVIADMPSFCTTVDNPVCTRGITPHVVRKTVTRAASYERYDANDLPAELRNEK